MSQHQSEIRRVTTHQLQAMKDRGEKISMLTAYDFSMARILDSAGIDVILVGDSASNVMAGNETTLPITLDQMIYHASSVVRGVDRALVVVDMPFGSYQGNSKEALSSAIRIMKESGAHAVKLEGGAEVVESIKNISKWIHFKNLLYSLLRYLIFSFQFFFLLQIFGVDVFYVNAMIVITSMYLLSSIIPSLAIFDVVVKGSMALYLFGIVGVNDLTVLSIITLMWILNFAIPALVGSFFVIRLKSSKFLIR